MVFNWFRRGKQQDEVSPEMSKMEKKLSFDKPNGFSLCSPLGNYCPNFPRFYKKRKEKMVEVGPQGDGEEGEQPLCTSVVLSKRDVDCTCISSKWCIAFQVTVYM